MSGRAADDRPLPVQLVVLAKRPVPGRVKTRLSPPYSPEQAAALAAAALTDTLDAVDAAGVAARALAWDGHPDGWRRPAYSVVEQCGGGLGDRLTAAVRDAYREHGLPVLVVGMDTPQITARLLTDVAGRLLRPGVDAVLGPATDGGFWTVGVRVPHPDAFDGVPMSAPSTFHAELRRLRELGLRVRVVGSLTDVDDAESARAVASLAPGTRFAERFAALGPADRAGHTR